MEKLSDEGLNALIEIYENPTDWGSSMNKGPHVAAVVRPDILTCLLELKQLRAEKAAYVALLEANKTEEKIPDSKPVF